MDASPFPPLRALHRWLAACGLACLGLLSACEPSPADQASATFHSLDIRGVPYAQDFALPNSLGQMRQLADFRGQVVVVFFGYTHCPDVCPVTLGELKEAQRLLGERGQQVQGIFISLDPKRDTPELLTQYMQAFDAGYEALTGTPEQIRDLAAHFRVYYTIVGNDQDPDYTIDHTAASFIFDTRGQIRLYNRFNQGADHLAADIRQLLLEAEHD